MTSRVRDTIDGMRATSWSYLTRLMNQLGTDAALYYIRDRLAEKLRWNGVCAVRLKQYRYPLYLRTGTSDFDVFKQVFLERQYACTDRLAQPRFIVDAGANIGCTTIYLLHQFPQARIVAIEPEAGNFAVLKKTVEPYGDRVVTMHAALWSHETRLEVVRGMYRDGRDWATQTREQGNERRSEVVQAVSMANLIDRWKTDVDLLKIDIEGAEQTVFGASSGEWLSRVRNIIVELHDDTCEKAFFDALAPYRFRQERSGELTFCSDIRS